MWLKYQGHSRLLALSEYSSSPASAQDHHIRDIKQRCSTGQRPIYTLSTGLLPSSGGHHPPQQCDGRLVDRGDNKLFNTHWIECSYPISGSYEPKPRYLFYVLALVTVLTRKSAWIEAAALGSVIAYSATATVHVIVLVALRTKLIPGDLSDYMIVLTDGSTTSGLDDGSKGALWLPVLPMAWDSD